MQFVYWRVSAFRNVKSVVSDIVGERVILQYNDRLTSFNPSSGEESLLTTTNRPIVSAHLWGGATMLTVVTARMDAPAKGKGEDEGDEKIVLETYNVDKGQHVM